MGILPENNANTNLLAYGYYNGRGNGGGFDLLVLIEVTVIWCIRQDMLGKLIQYNHYPYFPKND